jgi:hypothetical protein
MVSHELLFVPFSIHLLPSPTVFYLFIRKINFQKTKSGFEFEGDLQKLLGSACCDLENILEICGLKIKENTTNLWMMAITCRTCYLFFF